MDVDAVSLSSVSPEKNIMKPQQETDGPWIHKDQLKSAQLWYDSHHGRYWYWYGFFSRKMAIPKHASFFRMPETAFFPKALTMCPDLALAHLALLSHKIHTSVVKDRVFSCIYMTASINEPFQTSKLLIPLNFLKTLKDGFIKLIYRSFSILISCLFLWKINCFLG